MRRRPDTLRSLVLACLKVGIKVTVALLATASVVMAIRLLTSKPTPTRDGLREIPASALKQLNARLGTDGRRYVSTSIPVGSSTRSLTGAALLDSTPRMLRLEVGTQYYFRLKHKPPKGGGPASWDGATENYNVTLIQTSAGHWQVTRIKRIPFPTVHQG